MSSRKLTEVDKAYIEKFCDTKDANTIVKDLKKAGVSGIGVTTVQRYIDEYLGDSTIEDTQVEVKSNNLHIDPSELAGKHERGGVLTMTQQLSELLDETEGKGGVRDYRGKISRIRKDKPVPKGIRIDE